MLGNIFSVSSLFCKVCLFVFSTYRDIILHVVSCESNPSTLNIYYIDDLHVLFRFYLS